MDDIKWRLFYDVTGIYFWVDERLPQSIAASVVGHQFNDIVEFTPPNIFIGEAAVIIGAESEPNGTTFQLSFPLPDRSSGPTQSEWFVTGVDQC